MNLSRRKFLTFLAAPAVVTAANIMPVKLFVPPADKLYSFGSATGRWTAESKPSLQRIPFNTSPDFVEVLHKLRMEMWNSLMVDERILLYTDYSFSEVRLAA